MEITKLFKKPKFRRCSIYFYQQHRSVTEVEKLSDISRTTIYNFFRVFKTTCSMGSRRVECYDPNYMETSGLTLKSTYYYFTPKLLVDWLKELSGLNAAEANFLSWLFQNKRMDEFLRSADSWYTVVQRVGIALGFPAHFQKMMDMYPGISPVELETIIDKPLERNKTRKGRRKRTDRLKSVRDISPNKSKVATIVTGYPEDMFARFQKTKEMVNGFFKFVMDSPEVARSSYEKLSKATFPFEVGNPITNLWGFLGMFAGLFAAVDRMRE